MTYDLGYKIVLGVGLAVLVSGCTPTVQWSPTQPSPLPMNPRPINSVEVLHGQPPSRVHMEVGYITAQKKASAKTDVRLALIDRIQKMGAKLGCDAVLIRDARSSATTGSANLQVVVEGGCIMWTGEEQEASSAPADAQAVAQESEGTSPVGCSHDMHCKGDRICENGQCISSSSEDQKAPVDLSNENKRCEKDNDCPGDALCQSRVCKPAD